MLGRSAAKLCKEQAALAVRNIFLRSFVMMPGEIKANLEGIEAHLEEIKVHQGKK